MSIDAGILAQCVRAVELEYPGCRVQEFREQGQCSYTLLVSSPLQSYVNKDSGDNAQNDDADASCIFQIRRRQHAIDLCIAQAAKTVYPHLAPSIQEVKLDLPPRLCAYEMERKRGTPLSRLLPNGCQVESSLQGKHERLISSFAAFIGHTWQSACKPFVMSRTVRTDSPIQDEPDMLSRCRGRVGSSIVARLEKLSLELPVEHWRQKAAKTLQSVRSLEDYPVVLNHGDLIPSNILVDEETWEITGLVDWAEAEYLPFGTCLYGLELLLGFLPPTSPSTILPVTNSIRPSFTYFGNADGLRDLFWTQLFEAVPELRMRREEVKTMRDMGVLLWYGYAWDDGAIDRAVSEDRDPVEVACLREFLDGA